MRRLDVLVEGWADGERRDHWSTARCAQMSKNLFRLYRRFRFQIHARLGLLRSLAHRIAALLPRPPHQSISIESVVAGLRADIWLPSYIADMQRVLDENENRWVDPLDCQVFLQAWKYGAQWAHDMQDKILQGQCEDSRRTPLDMDTSSHPSAVELFEQISSTPLPETSQIRFVAAVAAIVREQLPELPDQSSASLGLLPRAPCSLCGQSLAATR